MLARVSCRVRTEPTAVFPWSRSTRAVPLALAGPDGTGPSLRGTPNAGVAWSDMAGLVTIDHVPRTPPLSATGLWQRPEPWKLNATPRQVVAAGMSPIAWTRRQVTVVRLGACGLELGAVCESLEAREPRGEE